MYEEVECEDERVVAVIEAVVEEGEEEERNE